MKHVSLSSTLCLRVLTFLYTVALWLFFLPHYLRHIGETSFFAFTSDFLKQEGWGCPAALVEVYIQLPWL